MTQDQIESTLRQLIEAVNQQNEAIKTLEAERVAAIDRAMKAEEERGAKNRKLYEEQIELHRRDVQAREAQAVATLVSMMASAVVLSKSLEPLVYSEAVTEARKLLGFKEQP